MRDTREPHWHGGGLDWGSLRVERPSRAMAVLGRDRMEACQGWK